MIVRYRIQEDEIWEIANDVSASNDDGLFSVEELLKETTLTSIEVAQRIDRFCEHNIVTRMDEDWSKKPELSDRVYLIIEHDLTNGREYEVLGIEADDYRILNDGTRGSEGCEPVLFSPAMFEIVNENKPNNWIEEYGDEGELYAYPSNWKNCFFEKYFDGVQEAREMFWNDLNEFYPWTAK